MQRRHVLTGIVLLSWLLTACATVQTSPPPPEGNERISIKVLPTDIGLNDLAIGAYRVAGSAFVVTTGRKVSTVEGAFGVLGVLSANSSGKDQAKEMLAKAESALRFEVGSTLESRLKTRMDQRQGSPRLTSAPPAQNSQVLELVPYAYLTVFENGQTSLQFFVKARLRGSSGSEIWWTRYIYYYPQARPLTGKDSWTADNAHFLKAAVAESIDQIAAVLLTDSRGASAGWDHKPVKINAYFVGMLQAGTLEGVLLRRTETQAIFSPKIGGGVVFYGINILPLSGIRIDAQ